VWHDSFICVTWLIHMYDIFTAQHHMSAMTPPYLSHDSFICVTWLIHMCAMTHSYVCHDSFMCAMTYSYVWHASHLNVKSSTIFIAQHQIQTRTHGSRTCVYVRVMCVTWLIHMCALTCHVCVVCLSVCTDVCGVSICVYWCLASSATSNTDSWTICSRTCVCGCHVSYVRLCDVCHARVMYVTRLIHVCFSWWVLQHCILDGYCSTVF